MRNIEAKPSVLLLSATLIYLAFMALLFYIILNKNGITHTVNFSKVSHIEQVDAGKWRVSLDTIFPNISSNDELSIKLIIEDESYFAEIENFAVHDINTFIDIEVPSLSEIGIRKKNLFVKLYSQKPSEKKLYQELFSLSSN